MAADPSSPVRADHRFIQQLMSTILGGRVEEVPREFDLLGQVFHLGGGSWERLFHGSPTDVALMKRVIKRCYQHGLITPKWDWNGASRSNGLR